MTFKAVLAHYCSSYAVFAGEVRIYSVLARISKGQGATSEMGTFMRKRWLKKGILMCKD